MKALARKTIAGFTAVELMLSLAVLAVGSAGIITMQRVTAHANRHARGLSTATHIAQAWLDQLVAESSEWKATGDYSDTFWIDQFQDGESGWFRPFYSSERRWGFAFDSNGNPQISDDGTTAFCAHLRMHELYPELGTPTVHGTGSQGSGLLRVEVRVYWLRSAPTALSTPLGATPCTWSETQVSSPDGLRAYHFVHMSTAILQHDSTL